MTLKETVLEAVEFLHQTDYRGAHRWAPELRDLGDKLKEAASQPSETVALSPSVVDKLAGLLAMLQFRSNFDMMRLGKMVQDMNNELILFSHWITQQRKIIGAARELQTELRKIRGDEGVCYLCSPPLKLTAEEMVKHDKEVHGVW